MKKSLSILILLALSGASVNAYSQNDKVLICHKGKEIYVAPAGANAHINQHGDTRGACPDSGPGPERPEVRKTVVMMRCEGITDAARPEGNTVQVVSASSSVPSFEIVPGLDCAVTLSRLLNIGYTIRSITSGSADSVNGIGLFVDYLLMGTEEVE